MVNEGQNEVLPVTDKGTEREALITTMRDKEYRLLMITDSSEGGKDPLKSWLEAVVQLSHDAGDTIFSEEKTKTLCGTVGLEEVAKEWQTQNPLVVVEKAITELSEKSDPGDNVADIVENLVPLVAKVKTDELEEMKKIDDWSKFKTALMKMVGDNEVTFPDYCVGRVGQSVDYWKQIINLNVRHSKTKYLK